MKIVYLAAGAAGMYCGSCLHDNTLAAALLKLGEDVLLVPTYTPLRTDEENVSDSHLFFGGINVYLQQKSSVFRHTPWFLDSLLDRPGMLNWATRGGPSLEAERLGDLTVSMLEGEHGHQSKEVRKLVHWLSSESKPDVVHLSNAMLLGMARRSAQAGRPDRVQPFGRGHLSRKTDRAALLALGRPCASEPRKSKASWRSITITRTSWPTISTCRASNLCHSAWA